MKKTFLFGMIALLSLSLVFMGCPQEAEQSDSAELTSVLEKTITATGTGTEAAPKTATITLTAAAANGAVKASDIVVAFDKASAKLYSDSGFKTEAATAGIALTVGKTTAVYILVTAEDGTKVYYKVSIALPKTVISSYSLKVSEDTNAAAAASGVTLDSAIELDGKVTLKLGGTITSKYILKAPGAGNNAYTEGGNFQPSADYWIGSQEKPAAGTYAAVYIKGALTWAGNDPKVLAIKNTNQALRLYAGNPTSSLLTAEPTKPKVTDSSNQKTIYIPATDPVVRWKLYSAIPNDDTFGILIWNGGTGTTYTPKTATLVIQEYNGYDSSVTVGADTTKSPLSNGYSLTVVVDYSDVKFADTVDATKS